MWSLLVPGLLPAPAPGHRARRAQELGRRAGELWRRRACRVARGSHAVGVADCVPTPCPYLVGFDPAAGSCDSERCPHPVGGRGSPVLSRGWSVNPKRVPVWPGQWWFELATAGRLLPFPSSSGSSLGRSVWTTLSRAKNWDFHTGPSSWCVGESPPTQASRLSPGPVLFTCLPIVPQEKWVG